MARAIGKAPRVSIGVPVYNGGQFLACTLDCLLTQTYSDFELIICDNCSDDQTEQICRQYVATDARIRYHRNSTNMGAPRNFNLAFALSRGEYFKWAAADDFCGRHFVERCVAVLDQRQEVVLCYPKTRLIDERNIILKDYEDRLDLQFSAPHKRFSRLLWNIEMCNAVFGLMRSKALKKTRLFGTYPSSDLVFLAELTLYGAFMEIPERLFFRRAFELSVVKYPSPYDRMIMFDSKKNGRWLFPNWRLFLGHLAAIHRAPFGLSERLRCYFSMRIWFRRWGRGLRTDVTLPLRQRLKILLTAISQ